MSSGNLSQSTLSEVLRQRVLDYFQGGWAKQLDVDQMFTLINGILPLEACLYYQVLPLFLDSNRLYLGMVTPNDTSALEYVRRIVSYLNYSLVPRAITYEAVQVTLTVYLNFTGTQEQSKTVKPRELFSYGHYRHSAQMRVDRLDADARPTLILDDSEELDRTIDRTQPPQPHSPLQATAPPPAPSLEVAPRPPSPQCAEPNPAAPNLARIHESPIAKRISPLPANSPAPAPALNPSIPVLTLQSNYLANPVNMLVSLPTPVMLQELLSKVLVGGIGRLYFECHPQCGRILWSQDGVLQSVLEQLSLPIFHQLLEELKRTAELQPSAIAHPRQVDVERLYEGNRVLLRFRFMPGQYGEEATLQVLRGAALRFHQQQQFSKLKRDALGIARQLQMKLGEIRDRAYAESGLIEAKEALPVLNQLLQTIEAQLETLETGRTEP